MIARTPAGARLMARVEPQDAATLQCLTDQQQSPVGSAGQVSVGADALLRWTAT